jgi:ubiquinone biosynthesis UbiH/UbiF/VisC/COQ6 family hydroxylase
MNIYGDRNAAHIQFDAYAAGASELAWTVEDAALQDCLRRALHGREALRIFAPAQCEALDCKGGAALLRLRDGNELSAALVVGADGANSFVRAQAGIAAAVREYGQAAVVANFECSRPHRNVACQWFQGGPVLALLPLPGERLSMIWSLPTEEAARVSSLEAEALCRRVEEATAGALGTLKVLTPPRSYPLRRLSSRRMVGARVALAGDAAHVIHPLAGQGLNLGLQDVRELARLLEVRAGIGDPGDASLLRAYERNRAEPILAMDFVVNGLYRLFASQGKGAGRLRNTGLNLTDRLTVLKNILIRQAMA